MFGSHGVKQGHGTTMIYKETIHFGPEKGMGTCSGLISFSPLKDNSTSHSK